MQVLKNIKSSKAMDKLERTLIFYELAFIHNILVLKTGKEFLLNLRLDHTTSTQFVYFFEIDQNRKNNVKEHYIHK